MSTTDYSDIVGVFRDRSKADQAIDGLKQAGISEDQIHLIVFDPNPAVEVVEIDSVSQHVSVKRFIVHVKAEGREQEAVGILVENGANNADLPPGTMLVHGTIVGANAESVDLVPDQSHKESFSDSFFGEVAAPGHPDDISNMDNPNAPHG
jgi:hypothetical protein